MRDPKFLPLCLGSEICPGLDTAAGTRCCLQSTAPSAPPAQRPRPRQAPLHMWFWWLLSRWGLGLSAGPGVRGGFAAGGCWVLAPSCSALGHFGREKRERRRVAVSSSSHPHHGPCPCHSQPPWAAYRELRGAGLDGV